MIIVNCAQGSDEWLRARAGVTTASNFKVATGRTAKMARTAAGLKLAFGTAIERISGVPLDDGFQTYAMKRGHEMEPSARFRHEQEIGLRVEPTGVVLTDDRKFGGSADGLIGSNGGAEYKCLISPESLMPVLLDGDITDYEHQIQGCMWLTGRAWWDFCLYCPALAGIGRDLTRLRVQRDDAFIDKMALDLLEFDTLVEQYVVKLKRA